MPTCPTKPNIDILLRELLAESGVTPSPGLVEQLKLYLRELRAWNLKINLTGLRTVEEMAVKHIGDTLTLLPVIPGQVCTVLDVGTGAGVPGLILKLLRPDLEIVLADAVRKKVSFLNAVIAFTGLRGIWAEHGRIGDAGIPGRVPIGGFDLVVSQAVTTVEGLVDIAGPMLSQKGIIISMKGPGAEEELKDKKELLQSRGWEIIVRMTRSAVRGYDRRLVLISRHEPVTRRQDIGNDRNAE